MISSPINNLEVLHRTNSADSPNADSDLGSAPESGNRSPQLGERPTLNAFSETARRR
jgi:hypothetical protein